MATPSTLDAILQRYGLKETDLNQEINDSNLEIICRKSCTNWRALPRLLGIDGYKIILANIERDYTKEDEKKLALFQEWQKMNGFDATYKVLVNALLETRQREDAQCVCEILKASLPVVRTGELKTKVRLLTNCEIIIVDDELTL